MKVTAFIDVRQNALANQQYQTLVSVYPNGKRPGGFVSMLPAGDPISEEILRLLRSFGKSPRQPPNPYTESVFRLEYRRTYEKSDWEAVPFLQPRPKLLIDDDSGRSMTNLILVQPKVLQRKITIAQASRPAIIVSEDLKRTILDAGLRHSAFKPVGVIGDPDEGYGQSWYRLTTEEAREKAKSAKITRFAENLWELSSDFVLPALSDKCPLKYEDGTPFDGDYSKGCCFLREDLYQPSELHYRRNAISGLETFDLALTYESFGACFPVWSWYRELVASQRFYQFCVAQKLNMRWVPVRIDPD
jgi:hypothetical protein